MRLNAFAASLTPPTAYRVKREQPELWADLMDQIAGALLPAQLDEIAAWLDFRPLDLPDGWADRAFERIEARREELAAEDVMQIVRDRFDF